MVDRHPQEDGSNGQLNRRQYLQMVTGAVGAAAMTGAGVAAVTSDPNTSSVVNLGDKGLQNGDVIDGYLDDYYTDGVEVRIPEGEYDWNGDGFGNASSDAAIVGQGEVILNNTAGDFTPLISVDSGTVAIKNLTLRGAAGPDKSRFRLEASSGGSVLIDNFNLPDGSQEGAESKAFYVPREHAGVVEIRNCYISGFSDNGIYASSPAYEGDGQVIVENTVAHNVNISGIRVGSSDSIVRNCLVINDAEATAAADGAVNQRGIRVREPGDNITIEGCEVIHSYEGAGAPIEIHDGAEGGSGQIVDTTVKNDAGDAAINEKGSGAADWTATNVNITGSGNLEYPSQFEGVCVGDGCATPSGDDPQNSGSGDSTTDGSTSDGSTSDGSTSDGSGDSSGGTTLDHNLVIQTYDGTGINYEFTATGEIAQVDVEDNDAIVQNNDGTYTATGETGNGFTDEFDFTGDLVAWSATKHPSTSSGEYELRLDGSSLDPASIGDDSSSDGSTSDGSGSDGSSSDGSTGDSAGDTLDNKLLIDGTDSDAASVYSFTVSGSVEASADLSSAPEDGNRWDELQDNIDGSTVTGVVGKGLDGYRYSGALVGLEVDGEVNITNEASN
ncbi:MULTISPECIES: right-handed parallel beta-helix repeat-containing protein [Salinibaculum]|uniref:right-handed parallel beta-helix repeat-containing protein n=1 Tax=Salinibaculum TaxID=2732368 RepID=UPI0030D4BED2